MRALIEFLGTCVLLFLAVLVIAYYMGKRRRYENRTRKLEGGRAHRGRYQTSSWSTHDTPPLSRTATRVPGGTLHPDDDGSEEREDGDHGQGDHQDH